MLLNATPTIRAGTPDDRDAIRALLDAAALPTRDIANADIRWLVAERDARVIGTIGVEVFGADGLLRSLAVAEPARGSGVGATLVRQLERAARDLGLRSLTLLTQGADAFFAHLGYTRVERSAVPDAVRASAQFRTLCPASAVCMQKSIAVSKRVLFVCVENSNRSQMAEAFAHRYGDATLHAASAGSRPSGRINPRAVRFMAELGYDLTTHRSKSLDDVGGAFDAVVTMGCGDSCPWLPAKRREDWNLPDPKNLPDADYRAVRDDIGRRVHALLAAL